jgi:phosphoglycolate phosphatase-like HAD superfamily hydrolase
LSEIPEKSRFEIVERIYTNIEHVSGEKYPRERAQLAIANYSAAVRKGVLECPELEGATRLLRHLRSSDKVVYISSNTPEEPLTDLIIERQWISLVNACFGFPRMKSETVRHILLTHTLQPSELIVIGDGKSDEVSALENGCDFFRITSDRSLVDFYNSLTLPASHVQG